MYSVKNTDYSSPYYYKTGGDGGRRNAEPPVLEEKSGAEDFSGDEAAVLTLDSMQKKKEEEKEEEEQGLVSQLLGQAEAMKESFEEQRENQTNLYDATMDLMMIANAEKETALKAIQVRLMFKMRTVKMSGAKSGEVQIAVNKIKKVIGKIKTKIKKLKEEAGIEKKRKNAEKAKKRKLEERLRRELEVRRTIRKNREKKDVEESRMGMGANYGGVAGSSPASMKDFGMSGISDGVGLEDFITGDLESDMGADSSAAAYAAAAAGVDGAAAAGVSAAGISAGDMCAGSIDVSI